MDKYVILKHINTSLVDEYVAFKYVDNRKAWFTHNLDFAKIFGSRDDALKFGVYYTAGHDPSRCISGLIDTKVFSLEEAEILMQHGIKTDPNPQYVICHNTSRYGIEFYRGDHPLGMYTRDLYKATRYKYSKDAFEIINNIEYSKSDYFVAEYNNIKEYLKDPKRNILPHVPDVSKKSHEVIYDPWAEEIMLGFNPVSSRNMGKSWLEKDILAYRTSVLGEPYPNAVVYLKKDIETTKEALERMHTNYQSYHTGVTPRRVPAIVNVIFNDPATIVIWADHTKTVVKANNGDVFNPETGLAMAIAKKALGNKHEYYNDIAKYLKKYDKQEKKDKEKCHKKQNKQ